MAGFKKGDKAWIVESKLIIQPVTILRCTGGIYLTRFDNKPGGIQVKEHRLFASEEEAKASTGGNRSKAYLHQYGALNMK